jgi:hypothetical protein
VLEIEKQPVIAAGFHDGIYILDSLAPRFSFLHAQHRDRQQGRDADALADRDWSGWCV